MELLNDNNDLEAKLERYFNKARDARGGNNNDVEVKIYNSSIKNAKALYNIVPDENGPLTLDRVVTEVKDYINDEYEAHDKFVIKIKENSKHAGIPITVKGGRSNNTKNSSMSMGNAGAGMLGLVVTLMQQNQQTQQQFNEFQRQMLASQKDNEIEYWKEQLKEREAQKKPTLLERLLENPAAQTVAMNALNTVLSQPNANIPNIPDAEFAKFNGLPPMAQSPTTENKIYQSAPTEILEDDEIVEMTIDQQKAIEALNLLERSGVTNAGDFIWTACHFYVHNMNTPIGGMLKTQLEQHKAKALQDL